MKVLKIAGVLLATSVSFICNSQVTKTADVSKTKEVPFDLVGKI